ERVSPPGDPGFVAPNVVVGLRPPRELKQLDSHDPRAVVLPFQRGDALGLQPRDLGQLVARSLRQLGAGHPLTRSPDPFSVGAAAVLRAACPVTLAAS